MMWRMWDLQDLVSRWVGGEFGVGMTPMSLVQANR